MMAKWLLLLGTLSLSACISLKEASGRYFSLHTKMPSVEMPAEVLERVERDNTMRHLLHGSLPKKRIIQCTFLRNQLLVAAHSGGLNGRDGDRVTKAALELEKAFQEGDQTFLKSCEQTMASPLGHVFLETQALYLTEE